MFGEQQFNLCSSINKTKTFLVETLGCKVNQYESMAVKSLLTEAGYVEVEMDEDADIIIINTCSVTHMADKKSRQTIRRIVLRNPSALVLVMGCYAQVNPEAIKEIEGVDIVIGTEGKSKIVEVLNAHFAGAGLPVFESAQDSFKMKSYEEIRTRYQPDKARAFIKVQDGCNLFCSYCIIPYARGRIRSRNIDDVISEVRFLGETGYREVVLTGIHLSSYGLDWQDRADPNFGFRLIDLIELISQKVPEIRIRLGSLEPGIVSADFADRIARIPGICDQFHLSLQSGSDSILKAMNRRYDTETYWKAVQNLRRVFDKPAISTDVIVGFPGETEALFEETMDFCQKIGFANLHVFPYSPREGTPAATMQGQVQKQCKTDRVNRLIALAEQMESEYLNSLVGTEQEIIIEQEEEGVLSGHARNYARVYMDLPEHRFDLHKKNILNCVVSSFENKKLKGVYNGLSVL
ncbi:MAG: tRNA (N(6)-L-threonylcarbamoyladenosine(37)-C(2))-methylthiotransferase MtaB [Bacillota bacterium]|nr:tRNA (N(6)-L-threonylcarbamoyladenosine(37)-C(2))-methylthiotransferase MtaB [Bacillota bacterium]